MEYKNHYSEYYFDYKLEQVGVDGGASDSKIERPRLYFERDYRKKTIPYSLSIIPREWIGRQEEYNGMEIHRGGKAECPPGIPYDTVHVVFGVGKVDYAPYLNRDSEEYRMAAVDKTFSFREFFAENGRLIVDDVAAEKSGAGVVEMLRGGEIIARFAFVVNCIRRKKISFEITRHAGQNTLDFAFVCKDAPDGIKVALVHHESRLPCLREDLEKNNAGLFELKFTAGAGKYKGKHVFRGCISDGRVVSFMASGHCFSFMLAEEWMNRYYVLDCTRNDTAHISRRDSSAVLAVAEHSCPFCHGVITASRGKDDRYRKGGIPCRPMKRGDQTVISNAFLPTVHKKNGGAPVKNCMYCVEDLYEDEAQNAVLFKSEFYRLLPADFMGHQDFKIVFAGSTRAGKTTYISRFFGIDGKDDEHVSMTMAKTAMGLKEFGIDVNPSMMEAVSAPERGEGDRAFRYPAEGHSWEENKKHYGERRISMNPPHYPEATTEADYSHYPFIVEVNGKAYVSFYDIAGEDAKRNKGMIGGLESLDNKPVGVFCIVNGEKDPAGNKSVVNILEQSELSPDCPVAVIVTKMDVLEKHFDPSSHCLRNGYFGKFKTYAGSEIQREIDFASEEVRSYLQANGLDTEFQKYRNIKYFGVSSFNFSDSIHEEGESLDARGNVFFDCSSKHLELPFLWMMKQFGIIN